jgi:NADPH:quinone reductase-like Zn-dependent oxidoreductase
MKAIIQKQYGGIETLEDVERNKPSIKKDEMLVKVSYANISAGDKNINTMQVTFPLNVIMKMIFGLSKPKAEIRGMSGSGIIEKIGSDITQFKLGDHVNFINSMKAGVLADYLVLKETSKIAKLDDQVSLADASPIAFGALSANHFIHANTIKKEMNVMIYGASGSVGSYAASLANYYGANVTMVASKKHHEKLSVIKGELVSYENGAHLELKTQFDVIFDAVGKINKKQVIKVLKKAGKFYSIKSPTKEDLVKLKELNLLLKDKKIMTIIDHIYSFDAYKEAHQKVYDGHKTGNIIIDINS